VSVSSRASSPQEIDPFDAVRLNGKTETTLRLPEGRFEQFLGLGAAAIVPRWVSMLILVRGFQCPIDNVP
jgi:hypothetical protein